MRLLPLSGLMLGLLACDAQPTAEHSASTTGRPAPTDRNRRDTSGSADSLAMQSRDQPAAVSPYRLLGVLDPDLNNQVAFALKVPRAWAVKQSFTRRWVGAMPQNQIYLSLTAPDGRAQIEYLPSSAYVYSEGPLTQQVREQAQALGMPPPRADNELSPLPPVAYIRQVLLPRLAQNGLTLREVGNEQEAPPQRDGQQQKLRGSVDGALPNGRRARVECRISLSQQQANGETYSTWQALPSITQSADDLVAAYAHTLVAQESIVTNPAWQQRMEELQRRGAQANSEASRQQHEATMGQINANTAAMTQAHNARMGAIAQQGAANTARHQERMAAMDQNKAAFDARMASGDQQQEISVDAIRGESKYEDPTTGARVKVEDGYHHVYRSRQDPTVYYGANTPLDPQQVDWQELRKVSLKDY